jgi:hypothetical protein
MTSPPSTWRAAVCYDAPSISKVVRETLDDLGWEYDRDRSIHSFSRLYVAISMPAVSYVFQFIVREPVEIIINVYEEKPSHAAIIHFIEIKGIDGKNAPKVRKFLQNLASSMPKEPYRFHWTERFKAGLLNRHHINAKRDWGKWGV